MFTPSSFEKGCFPATDNSRSGRGSTSSRYPIGITSLGDENQQIRIQLAVHKYNNSASGPDNNRRNLMAPVRHSFTRSLLRSKNYEEDAEPTVRNERKPENQYEGVGAFPTVHLKKNVVLYRPFRKYSEVKVPCPELPVNRFLSHLPELCSDMKSDNRSALDVLQDMSRKKIHSREEDDYNKLKSKGLCGDFVIGAGATYKPLFVRKQKPSAVLTKDNTTQTLLSHSLDATSPHNDSRNTVPTSSGSDQKAELRRKLARQNNEIFASLSSSIFSSFPVKRKIDKVLPATDNEHLNGESAVKKPKISENNITSGKMNVSKFISSSNSNDNSAIICRKSKVTEITSTSPNKDRLTTIYLDMEDTSLKNQIFSNNSSSSETKTCDQTNSPALPIFSNNSGTNNDLAKGNGSLSVNGSGMVSNCNNSSNSLKNSNSLNFISSDEKKTTLLSNSTESKPESNMKHSSFATGQAITNSGNSKSEVLLQDMKSSNSLSANFLNHPTLACGNALNGKSESPGDKHTEKISNNITNAKSDSERNVPSQNMGMTFTFGSLKNNDSCLNGTFKFGVEGNFTFNSAASKPNIAGDVSKTDTSSFIATTATTTTTTASIDDGKTKAIAPIPVTQNFDTKGLHASSLSSGLANFQQNNASSQNNGHSTFLPSVKHLFGSNEQSVSDKANIFGGNPEALIPTTQSLCSATSSLFNQSIQTSSITTTQESKKVESLSEKRGSVLDREQNSSNIFLSQPQSTNTTNTQTSVFSSAGNTVQAGVTQSTSCQTTTLSQNSQASNNKELSGQTNSLFMFGQKTAIPTVSASQPTSLFGTVGELNIKKQPSLSFVSQDSDQNKATNVTTFEQKNANNLFTFGIKPPASESTESKPGTTNMLGQLSTPQSNLSELLTQSKTDQPVLFGQKVSQTISSLEPSTSQVSSLTHSQNLSAETSGVFGAKPQNITFGHISTESTFKQKNSIFPTKTPIFGSATNQSESGGFGSSSTQPTNGFGTSTTSNQTSIVFKPPASTQSSAFGIPSSIMTSNGFGSTATTQSSPFGSTATTQSSPFGFSPASSTQSSTSFGVASVTQPTTGFSLSSVSQTSLVQPFGQNNNNNNNKPNSIAPTSNIFGQTVNQNPVTSSGFASPSNLNFNSSASQNNIFGPKNDTSVGIFGQSTKIQTPGFGQALTSPSFGETNKFSFGMSTSNPTGFTASPPTTTTTATVFNFGGGNSAGPGSAYSFGGSTSLNTNNAPPPFAFKGSANDTFKFGASSTKEESGFGVANTATFTFGNQVNNPTSEPKPAGAGFTFGSSQASASVPTFNFGSTPSPGVFSFGASTSSASSGSTFNFGTPQPGGPFGHSSTLSPAPFPVPGNFSIGSGSSQSRPRASSRLRRRP